MKTHILLEDCNTKQKILVPINSLVIKSPLNIPGFRSDHYVQIIGDMNKTIEIYEHVFEELVELLGIKRKSY